MQRVKYKEFRQTKNTLVEFIGSCQAGFIITRKILSKPKSNVQISRIANFGNRGGGNSNCLISPIKIQRKSVRLISLFFFLLVLDNFTVNFIFTHLIYHVKEQYELLKGNNKPLARHQGYGCFMYL